MGMRDEVLSVSTHDQVNLSQTMTDWGRMPQAAIQGREMYEAIRDMLFDLRNRGIPVRKVWVNKHVGDKMHAMWDFIAAKYDLKLPFRIERVPIEVGATGGQDVLVEKGDPGDPLTPYIEGISPPGDRPVPKPGSLMHAIQNAIGTDAAKKYLN